MVDDPNGRTALYRLFDGEGALLYIGISRHPQARWKQHEAEKPWWPRVERKETTWYVTRLAAGAAEQEAIKSEHPAHNDQRDERRIALITPRLPRSTSAAPTVADPRARTEPADHDSQIRMAKAEYDKARKALFDAIRAALLDGIGPSPIARFSGFSREYIAKIRDGKGPKDI